MGLEKPLVNVRKEPLRYMCNEAFFALRRLFPASWPNAPIAFVEGALAGYAVAEVGAHIVPESRLEQIAAYGVTGTLAIPIGNCLIAPEYWKAWRKEQPTYSSGVLGVMVGASIRALQEIL